MAEEETDWGHVLSEILESSPLLIDLPSTLHKRARRSNGWQCHILACVLTCLAPRLGAEVLDLRVCVGLEPEARDSVQVALEEVCHAIRAAERFVQACDMEDAVSLVVATACTGEGLAVHLHNLYWCVSSLLLSTRLAMGFSDDRLSALIEQQAQGWSDIISRYLSLGAELLDHKLLASMAEPDFLRGSSTRFSPDMESVSKLLSHRLKWAFSKDGVTHLNQEHTLLEGLRIDHSQLVFEDAGSTDSEVAGTEKRPFIKASWAGIPVSMKWCHSSDLLERASMLLKMKNPFILQLIGWSQVADTSGSSYYLVMEDVQTELEGFIRERAEARSTRDEQEMLFPFSMALDMMMQIARGMWYLHRNGIAYMTLRSREVLLTVSKDDRARNSIGRLKLCHSALPLFAHSSTSLDFSADVLSFGLLCKEILTGNPQSIDAEGQLQLPTSTPLMLSDCLKACWNPKPQSRPEFGVICRLLRHLKLIVSNPLRLERLLYFNEAARAASKAPSADTISPVSKVRGRPDVDVMSISLQLIDINVRLLHAITPPDIYPLVAASYYEAEPPTSFNTLVDISSQLMDVLSSDPHETSSSSSITQQRFVTANTGTLMTSLVLDGPMGLLKSGWIRTALGLGTLEKWLQSLSADWKNIHKVALGVALCLKHVCMTPPKIGYYSQEHGSVDGFYPIHPKNFLLNSQFKVALLLDNSPNAWKGLIQWAGAHPHAGEGADGVLISIEAFTTFYYGHLLSFIINAHQSKTNSSLQHYRHCEFVLTNLANRCIQLKYLSMTEVVTILLSDNKLHQNI